MKSKKIKPMTLGKKTIANLEEIKNVRAGGKTTSQWCTVGCTERPSPQCTGDTFYC